MLDNLNLREISAPEMIYLSNETGEAVYLAIPENLSVVYIDKLDSPKIIRSWHPIGGSAPMHCVGTGKAILAENYNALRLQVSGRLTRYTDLTITSLPELDIDIETTRRRGYAYGRGEFRDGILSFGAAITLPGGEAIAALGVSFPKVNMPDRGPEWVGALVAHAAESVSIKLRQF
jgi:DNA-binding IclR family transcriptional regulator